jgi:hypothetical protein
MPAADTYRKHAQECITLAATMRDPEHRNRLNEIAEAWIELAEDAEFRESGETEDETPSAP